MKLFLLIFSFPFCLFAQSYDDFIATAENHHENEDYLLAGQSYSKAFRLQKGYSADMWDAAIVWSKANFPDSSFYLLSILVDDWQYSTLKFLTVDSDFSNLYKDVRWPALISKVEKMDDGFNQELIALLAALKNQDQKVISDSDDCANNQKSSDCWEAVLTFRDSANHVLKDILNTYGFPGFSKVGNIGSGNFWIVVQHMDHDVNFQQQVLDSISVHLKQGNASSVNYAYLTDRVKTNLDEKQIYGTQLSYDMKSDKLTFKNGVIDPEGLDDRRKEVGLPSVDYYLSIFRSFYGL